MDIQSLDGFTIGDFIFRIILKIIESEVWRLRKVFY